MGDLLPVVTGEVLLSLVCCLGLAVWVWFND